MDETVVDPRQDPQDIDPGLKPVGGMVGMGPIGTVNPFRVVRIRLVPRRQGVAKMLDVFGLEQASGRLVGGQLWCLTPMPVSVLPGRPGGFTGHGQMAGPCVGQHLAQVASQRLATRAMILVGAMAPMRLTLVVPPPRPDDRGESR